MGVFNAVTAVAGVIGSLAGGWAASRWGYAAVPVAALCGVAAGLIAMSAARSGAVGSGAPGSHEDKR